MIRRFGLMWLARVGGAALALTVAGCSSSGADEADVGGPSVSPPQVSTGAPVVTLPPTEVSRTITAASAEPPSTLAGDATSVPPASVEPTEVGSGEDQVGTVSMSGGSLILGSADCFRAATTTFPVPDGWVVSVNENMQGPDFRLARASFESADGDVVLIDFPAPLTTFGVAIVEFSGPGLVSALSTELDATVIWPLWVGEVDPNVIPCSVGVRSKTLDGPDLVEFYESLMFEFET